MLRPEWIDDASAIDDPFGYGERAVTWLRNRRHPKSPDGRFTLDPWQERIVRRIYGPRHPDGTRIVREVFLGLPRGNRKTALSAALMLLHLCGPEAVEGGHLVSAASTRKQAREAFEEAAMLCVSQPKWRKKVRLQDHKSSIRFPAMRTRYEALSADAGGAHGMTIGFALVDELHAHQRRDLWDAVRTGCDKLINSLLIVATTAGSGSENICAERWNYACRVQRGEVTDPAFVPVIFAAEDGDDWESEELWHAVNPGMAYGYPPLEPMRKHALEAKELVGSRKAFQQLRLNIWQAHSENPFIDMAVYDEGSGPVDLDALKGKPCWIAVDLGSTLDLTAVVACWIDDDGRYVVHPWFFCPEATVTTRQIKGHDLTDPFRRWADEGFITPTPGNATDFKMVQKHIEGLCGRFDVQSIAFDPWRAGHVMAELQDKGAPVVEFRQGSASMVPAIDELERAIVSRRFVHGGNPVLRWNFENIRCSTDRSGNRTFHKKKSKDKIDGAVAAAMAIKLAFDSLLPQPAMLREGFDFNSLIMR